ncbi:MAG: siphovirus Gp157 family protein [Treponema sp.]|jgi:hypothetical protein|nr:siphovirus Gp157 family protein [Treponema sp.]
MTMYEIIQDIRALKNLVESLEDEDGNPRDPSDEERKIVLEWIAQGEEAFPQKADNICKLVKNLEIEAAVAEAERGAHKKELDRLSRTAKAREHKAQAVRAILHDAMNILKMKKYKSALFSVNIQAAAKSAKMADGSPVPPEFAKPLELDGAKVRAAIEDGSLVSIDNMLYTRSGEKTGIAWLGSETIVIR